MLKKEDRCLNNLAMRKIFLFITSWQRCNIQYHQQFFEVIQVCWRIIACSGVALSKYEILSLLPEEVKRGESCHRERENGISNLMQFQSKNFTFITASP